MNAIQEITFDTYVSVEGAKPILFGFIIPLIITLGLQSLFAGIACAIVAAAVQAGIQNNVSKAKETLWYACIIPTFVGIVFLIPAAIAVNADSIRALF